MRLPPRLAKVILVEPLERFQLRLTFDDGFIRTVNLEPWLEGAIFEPLRTSEAYFRTVHLERGTIAWANGANIDSDVLRYDFLKPAGMKQGVAAITVETIPKPKVSRQSNRSDTKRSSPSRLASKSAQRTTLTKKSSPRA